MASTRTRAILFDFDGVLARTMEDNFRAWRTVFARRGVDLKPEDFFPYEGMKLEELVGRDCQRLGLDPGEVGSIIAEKERIYTVDHKFELYPYVEELTLAFYSRGIPMAIVSAGRAERITATAPAPFLARFATLITAEKAGRGKPFPDPYQAGAEALGVPAADCVVVENAPLGIESAKAAGAYCIAIASTLDVTYLSRADAVVSDFHALREVPTIQTLL